MFHFQLLKNEKYLLPPLRKHRCRISRQACTQFFSYNYSKWKSRYLMLN